MEEQCQQTSTTMANSGQTIGKRIKKKKKKSNFYFLSIYAGKMYSLKDQIINV